MEVNNQFTGRKELNFLRIWKFKELLQEACLILPSMTKAKYIIGAADNMVLLVMLVLKIVMYRILVSILST